MVRRRSLGWTVTLCSVLLTVPAACRRADGALDDRHPHTSAVLAALDDERPQEMRLDRGTSFQACTPARDTAPAARAIGDTHCRAADAGTAERLARLAVEIAADTAAAGSSDVLWATAILDLASGTTASLAQVERAILHLTEVHAREPLLLLPRHHLAIAHRIRASQRQESRELYEALDWLESALEEDSTNTAVRYNRALLQAALHLPRVANADWATVAATDPDRGWRRDAESRVGMSATVAVEPSSVAHAAPAPAAGSAAPAASAGAIPTMVTGAPDLDALLAQAQQLTGASLHRAAARVLHEARLAALATNRPQDVPEILGRLAITEAQLGRTSAALALVSEARRMATSVVPAGSREHVTAGLDRAESLAMEAQDPMAALRLLDASAAHFRQMPMEFVSVLAAGGRMASRVEDVARAERLLDSAVMMAARLAPTVSAADASQLREVATASRRTLVDMALARGDTAQAFARTVTLSADANPRQGAAPARWPVLGPRDGELRFVVQDESVLAWLRTARGVQLHRWTVPRQNLQHAVARLVRRVRTGGAVESTTGPVATLSATLLGPLMNTLRALDHLDVHADDVTTRLPVGLLTDGTGMLLLERMAIRTVLPAGSGATSSVVGDAADVAGTTGAVDAAPLLIADPAWSARDFPGLEPLRSAEMEVRRIERLYPQGVLLRGAAATRGRVREELARHAVVHFAGHSMVVPDDPARSQLVLSAGRDLRDGVLYAADIAALPLRGVRLVVLSACGMLDEEGSSVAGANPLATAFIDAGSSAVVAGSWEVDDDDSAELMAQLHAELQRGATPEVALQRASVLLLRDPGTRARRLETVAAYMVFGRGR